MTPEQTRALDDRVLAIEQALSADDLAATSSLIADAPTHEVVAVIERLDARRRAVVYRLLPKQRALEVFEDLPASLQGDLVDALQDSEVAAVFADLDPDDRVRLLDELPASVAPRLLRGLPVDERTLTAAVLGYPQDSVGRRMSPEYVTLRPSVRVSDALARVRSRVRDAETVYTIPVIDDARTVVGVISLRDLLGVLALPIVDSEGRLVGILTIDDAVRILEQEESEDAARQGGAEPLRRPYLSTPILRIVRSRVVWLFVLAVGATLTVQVLSVFEDTLAQLTVLALFVPLLIGTGGNTGNQAATTVTRALALSEVRTRDVWRVLSREVRVGALLGLLLGVLGFAITSVVFDLQVGLVIGLTLLSICTVAASVGGVMPLLARAIRVDPAVFSNPFITTFVDATGLVIYFLIARAVLQI